MKKDVIYSSAFIRNLRSQEEMSLKYKKNKRIALEVSKPIFSFFLNIYIYTHRILSLVIVIDPSLPSYHEPNNTLSCERIE